MSFFLKVFFCFAFERVFSRKKLKSCATEGEGCCQILEFVDDKMNRIESQ